MKIASLIIRYLVLGIVLSISTSSLYSQTEIKLKDLVNVRGYRTNSLVGMGLVVGLSDTGDSNNFLTTNTMARNMLNKLGLHIGEDQTVSSKNIASVVVSAQIPAFKRNGDRIDVKISAIGDSSDLTGGQLLATYLKAGDGKVYAVASGMIVNGAGKKITSLTLPEGATVEQEFSPNIAPEGVVTLSLKEPDFTTASRIQEAINLNFKGFYAKSVDPSGVTVEIPPLYEERVVDFIGELENIVVNKDKKAVIVFNEKTGTIVIGDQVVIDDISITHNGVNIDIKGGKFSEGGKPSTVGEFIKQATSLGLKSGDLIAILKSMHKAGAITAELQFL